MLRLLSIIFLVVLSIRIDAQTLNFDTTSNSWDEILQQAQNSAKPIFVDVYTEWCGPCKWMDKHVFSDKQVMSFFESNFLPVKIDAEKGYGPEFSKRHAVGGYPTFLFFSPKGELLLAGIGSLSSEILIQSGKQALDNLKNGISLSVLSPDSANWKMTPEETLEYIKKMSIGGKPNGTLIEYYLKALPMDSLYNPQVFDMITFGRFSRFPLDGRVLKVLLYEYRKYPVKSGELMSAWNTIRNNLKNFADSAGANKDLKWLDEIWAICDSLNNSIKDRKRERLYFKSLYYAGAHDGLKFIQCAVELGKEFITNANKKRIFTLDSINYAKSLHIKFGINLTDKIRESKEYRTHKDVFIPESKLILDEMLDLYYQLKLRFPASYKVNKDEFQNFIRHGLLLYQNNPVMVRQSYVNWIKKSILGEE